MMTVISASIEGLSVSIPSMLTEMCQREHCHCLCFQETQRNKWRFYTEDTTCVCGRAEETPCSLDDLIMFNDVGKQCAELWKNMVLLFATTRSVVKSVKVPIVEAAKHTN